MCRLPIILEGIPTSILYFSQKKKSFFDHKYNFFSTKNITFFLAKYISKNLIIFYQKYQHFLSKNITFSYVYS